MKEIRIKESIEKDKPAGPSLAYRMRKGLLKGKEAHAQQDYTEDPSEYADDQAKQAAESSVNISVNKAVSKRRDNRANKRRFISDSDTSVQIIPLESQRTGAADMAAPSFEVSEERTSAKRSVTVEKRRQPFKKTHYKSKTVTNSVDFDPVVTPAADANPVKRSFISKRAEEISQKKANKTVEKSSTAIGRALTGAVRSVKEGVSNLFMLLAAGGSMPMIVIILICSIGLAVGSVFGIFFASEDTGSEKLMQTVVREINAEYVGKIKQIKEQNPHDSVEMSGSSAVWREVLSFYAVKVNTDPNDPQDVASLDEDKIRTLRTIFWAMNEIDYKTEQKTEIETVETADEEGNIISEEKEVEKIVLYITVSHKTADQIADEYGFSLYQKQQLAELLNSNNSSLWAAVLYGIHSGDTAIIEVAASQIGNEGGEPYWSWYGFSSRVEWCACFVSWCANECGYIEDGIIPKNANCNGAVRWFKDHDQWADGSAEPIPGMIIYFDWDNKGAAGDQNGTADHVGIVEKVENGWVHTIEGNSRDSVRRSKYRIGHYEILGYGIPRY